MWSELFEDANLAPDSQIGSSQTNSMYMSFGSFHEWSAPLQNISLCLCKDQISKLG